MVEKFNLEGIERLRLNCPCRWDEYAFVTIHGGKATTAKYHPDQN